MHNLSLKTILENENKKLLGSKENYEAIMILGHRFFHMSRLAPSILLTKRD
jgi:hypothetical protein